ncbi:MAG: HAMP domain-containing histidine kinase [Deltaproteobacteria bacterium]|nr:HAMP domain-containing histidine kinase [Deltaproteobacteria bacterium]
MVSLLDMASLEGLRFFGRISASISHELKNTLSIMNESAGLLEDLALLAEQGKALDASRVKTLSALIKRQIQRTDQIIRNMNRFSHTVDEPLKEIELLDFLEFVLAVCRRLTAAKGIVIQVTPKGRPLTVVTRPFFLHRLIWLLLEIGMGFAGKAKALTLIPEKTESGVSIRLTGLETLTPETDRIFPENQEQTLLTLLEARLTMNLEEKSFALVLPQRIKDEGVGGAA